MASRPRVLVIDDDEAVLARVAAALEAASIEPIVTTQIVGTAKHLRSCDLVLVDFHMPGLDGASVVASLRAALEGVEERPSFYLFTSDAEAARTWKGAGFDGCLSNKGDDEHVVLQVQAALRTRRVRLASKAKARG